MPSDAVEPTSCPECGHPVYRPLVVPVRRQQRSCRAIGPSDGTDGDIARCGCENVAHRFSTMRPRHRVEAPTRPADTD